MSNETTRPWDRADLAQLLHLEPLGAGRWRAYHSEPNPNNRCFGGQLLGQALMAALREAPDDRAPSMMQFLFLQGADPGRAVDLCVERLQEGKRFTALHVRASQGERMVLDAQVSCAVPIDGPLHATSIQADLSRDPARGGTPDMLSEAVRKELRGLGGYSEDRKPSIDFFIPEIAAQFPENPEPRMRFWIRAGTALGADARLQAAAFAYLSDWWLNFSGLGPHRKVIADRPLYVASLNHCIWFHQPVVADQWLHVDTISPGAASGRSLSVANIHDAQGRLVASTAQQSLMGFAAERG